MTKPEEINNNDCGSCPYYSKAFIGDEKGPSLNVTCLETAERGQWTWNTKNIKCLTATTCEEIKDTDCGWCPSLKKAFIGNFDGPFSGIDCPMTEEGQWTYYTNDCKCLKAKSCDELKGTNCGWCSSLNKVLLGDKNSPFWDVKCPIVEGKQWIFNNNCKCLTVNKCEDTGETENCGWCPSLKRGFIGILKGPLMD